MAELREEIEKGRVKNIWSWDRSRMFRDMTDAMIFKKDYVEKHKVKIYEGETATLRTFDNPDERFLDQSSAIRK